MRDTKLGNCRSNLFAVIREDEFGELRAHELLDSSSSFRSRLVLDGHGAKEASCNIEQNNDVSETVDRVHLRVKMIQSNAVAERLDVISRKGVPPMGREPKTRQSTRSTCGVFRKVSKQVRIRIQSILCRKNSGRKVAPSGGEPFLRRIERCRVERSWRRNGFRSKVGRRRR